MNRFIITFLLIFACTCMSAQNFKVLKVGGTAPKAKNGKVLRVGDGLYKLEDIKWPSKKDCWLKLLDTKKRKISYVNPYGSAQNLSGLIGNSELSCKTKFQDVDAYSSPIQEIGEKTIPKLFRIKDEEVVPYKITMQNIELDENDNICIAFYDYSLSTYQFKRVPICKTQNGFDFILERALFPVMQPGKGLYISFYLVRNNNYTLLKDKSTIRF